MDSENSETGKELIPALNAVSNEDGTSLVESELDVSSSEVSDMVVSVEPVMVSSGESNVVSSVEPISSVEPVMTSSGESDMVEPISLVKPVEPVLAPSAESDMASSVEATMVPTIEPATVINDAGGITDKNTGANSDQASDSAPDVKNEQESGQINTPDESDESKPTESKANVMDANKDAMVKIKKDDNDSNDDNDNGGKGVKTYSGYVPISQSMFDWEPPTSLDNQTQPTPPPDTNQEQPHASNPDGNMYARKPVEGLVYTEVGEKARPTPYIYEIKARKFEKRKKNKLFVGGLVFEATKEFLYDLFEKYGELEDACIVTERGTGNSRGFGYVTFVNQDEAEEAIKAIDGLRINGKTLCVEFADDPKSSPGRGPPGRGRGPPGRGRSRGYGRHYDMDRYPSEDPYYYDERPDPYCRHARDDPYYDYPPPRDYYRPPPRDYDRPPPRDYDRLPSRDYDRLPPRDYGRPPPRDYDRPPRGYDRPPPRDYERPPPRDYYRPPPRDYYDAPRYDHHSPRDYDAYRRPPASYDEDHPPAPRRENRLRDVDVARLRVDREKVRSEKYTSVEQQRLLARQKKKQPSSSSSSSDSSDSEATKAKGRKRHRVIPKAYMM